MGLTPPFLGGNGRHHKPMNVLVLRYLDPKVFKARLKEANSSARINRRKCFTAYGRVIACVSPYTPVSFTRGLVR